MTLDVLAIESFHNYIYLYMGMEPTWQVKICRKWDEIFLHKTDERGSTASQAALLHTNSHRSLLRSCPILPQSKLNELHRVLLNLTFNAFGHLSMLLLQNIKHFIIISL